LIQPAIVITEQGFQLECAAPGDGLSNELLLG